MFKVGRTTSPARPQREIGRFFNVYLNLSFSNWNVLFMAVQIPFILRVAGLWNQ